MDSAPGVSQDHASPVVNAFMGVWSGQGTSQVGQTDAFDAASSFLLKTSGVSAASVELPPGGLRDRLAFSLILGGAPPRDGSAPLAASTEETMKEPVEGRGMKRRSDPTRGAHSLASAGRDSVTGPPPFHVSEQHLHHLWDSAQCYQDKLSVLKDWLAQEMRRPVRSSQRSMFERRLGEFAKWHKDKPCMKAALVLNHGEGFVYFCRMHGHWPLKYASCTDCDSCQDVTARETSRKLGSWLHEVWTGRAHISQSVLDRVGTRSSELLGAGTVPGRCPSGDDRRYS